MGLWRADGTWLKAKGVAHATILISIGMIRKCWPFMAVGFLNMTEPDYKRHFDVDDFRGYFKWTRKLSKKLGGNLYHACHRDELKEILDSDSLVLRSHWSLKLPSHGVCKVPGVWTGLNYFVRGNHYGPFLIQLPLSLLNGKAFIAFRRKSDRHRYFFVQYESRIPIYSFKGKSWRRVRSETYFAPNSDNGLMLKNDAIYDIVLTTEIPLKKTEIIAVNHPRCIPEKCKGMNKSESRKALKKIALNHIRKELNYDGIMKHYLKTFPDIKRSVLKLKF